MLHEETMWLAAYQTTPIRESPEIRRDLDLLAARRGRGETLVVRGDIWGGGDVVVAIPRARENALEIVEYDPAAYPAIAEACRVRTPNDDD